MIVKIQEIARDVISFAVDSVIIMAVVAVSCRWRRIIQSYTLIYLIEAPNKLHVPQITDVDYLLPVSIA